MDKTRKYKTDKNYSTLLTQGRIMPSAVQMEKSILGAVMLIPSNYDVVASYLKSECFYLESHQLIFKAIQSLHVKNQNTDVLSVVEELRSTEDLDKCGDAHYLNSLTNWVVGLAENHCKIVYEKYILREVIKFSSQLFSEAFEPTQDPFELMDSLVSQIDKIKTQSFGDMVPIDAVLVEAMRKIEYWRGLESTITGIPSGFMKLDKLTRGWQDGDLIIIAARPSAGKTAFMLNLVRHAASYFERKKTVKVWSLEMKSMRLVLRLLAAEAREYLEKIQTGRLSDDQMKRLYTNGVQKLASRAIFFDDTDAVNIRKIKAKAKKRSQGMDTGICFLDYMQLAKPEGGEQTREQEISKISRGLKSMAMELQVPVIALSQLSREIEKRSNKIPQLSDLRESGAIEQDADVVIFLWGPTDDEVALDPSLDGKVYVKIAKQRDGMLGTFELNFKGEFQLFSENAIELPGNWRQIDLVDYTEPKKKEEEPF